MRRTSVQRFRRREVPVRSTLRTHRSPGASGTGKMSSDGLFYATCHRHYEQPPNCRHRNCQWMLPSATVTAIPEMPTELAAAATSGDLPTVNALFKRRDGHGGNGDNKKKQPQCWYHGKFGDESRCCSGPPCLESLYKRVTS